MKNLTDMSLVELESEMFRAIELIELTREQLSLMQKRREVLRGPSKSIDIKPSE